MAATARATVLFDPVEKAALEARARAAHTSTGEFIKRAVAAYDPENTVDPVTMAQIEAYVELVGSAVKTMNSQLDASIAKIDRILDPVFIAEERLRIENEVAQLDVTAIRERLGLAA